jgi:hypothetical protein
MYPAPPITTPTTIKKTAFHHNSGRANDGIDDEDLVEVTLNPALQHENEIKNESGMKTTDRKRGMISNMLGRLGPHGNYAYMDGDGDADAGSGGNGDGSSNNNINDRGGLGVGVGGGSGGGGGSIAMVTSSSSPLSARRGSGGGIHVSVTGVNVGTPVSGGGGSGTTTGSATSSPMSKSKQASSSTNGTGKMTSSYNPLMSSVEREGKGGSAGSVGGGAVIGVGVGGSRLMSPVYAGDTATATHHAIYKKKGNGGGWGKEKEKEKEKEKGNESDDLVSSTPGDEEDQFM